MSLESILKDIAALPNHASRENRAYLGPWEKTMWQLLNWSKHTNAAWGKVIQKNMTGDDLIPFTLVQLQSIKPSILKQAKKKLEDALSLDDITETGYYMTNMYSAISLHFELTKEKQAKEIILPKVSDEQLEQMTSTINFLLDQDDSSEIDYKIKYDDTLDACLNYKNHLVVSLANRLNRISPPAYMHFFKEPNNFEACELAVQRIKELRYKGKFSSQDNEFNILLDKYLVIHDLLTTLNRKDVSIQHTYEEFNAKYELHKTILEKNNDAFGKTFVKTIGGFLLLDKLIDLITFNNSVDHESHFNSTATLFGKKDKPQEPSLLNQAADAVTQTVGRAAETVTAPFKALTNSK